MNMALKVCSSCGAQVQRKDCHKNRFNEYICRACQSRGVKFTWRPRLRRVAGVLLSAGFASALVAALLTLLAWLAFHFLAFMVE